MIGIREDFGNGDTVFGDVCLRADASSEDRDLRIIRGECPGCGEAWLRRSLVEALDSPRSRPCIPCRFEDDRGDIRLLRRPQLEGECGERATMEDSKWYAGVLGENGRCVTVGGAGLVEAGE